MSCPEDMKVDKTIIIATILLLALSSTSATVSASSVFLCGTSISSLPSSCVGVDTHGPRVSAVEFSAVTSFVPTDLQQAGNYQVSEWTFTVSDYNSYSPGTQSEGETVAYNSYGIAFNTIAPYMNNVYFRAAIAQLISVSYISTTTLASGAAGFADENFMPCNIYASPACTADTTGRLSGGGPYAEQAWKDLVLAGLIPSVNCAPTYSTSCMSGTSWYAGASFEGYGGAGQATYVTAGTCPATYQGVSEPSACAFNPLFYYRNDDPLREGPSVELCSVWAPTVGLNLNCKGIPDSSSGADIYDAAESAIACYLPTNEYSGGAQVPCTAHDAVSASVEYDPSTGGNTLPTNGLFSSVAVNGSATVTPTDAWNMYTYGWGLSAYYTFPYFFFNTAFVGTDNFVNYYNSSMDIATNSLIYATTPSGAATAAGAVAKDLAQQLPYIGYYYGTELYVVQAAGWTGYANLPAYGPSTETGLSYTLLNVHESTEAMGGTFNLALHSVADEGGMNPLYHDNWVWQVDVWGNVYDSPLATPPTQSETPNAFIPWMTVANNTFGYSSMVSSFTGSTGTTCHYTAGEPHTAVWYNCWFDFLNPKHDSTNTPVSGHETHAESITGGQVVTFVFRNNITWTDNVPLTAEDYAYSLWAWDLSGTSGAVTPVQYALAGPEGLISTHVQPVTSGFGNNCTVTNPCSEISMYVGSNSVWNLASLVNPVIPQHIFADFNIKRVATNSYALDLTQPSTSTATDAASSSHCACMTKDPAWQKWLPNLEVASGPFLLYAYSPPPSGAGELLANPNYDRSPVAYEQTVNTQSASGFTYSTTIQEFVRTSTAASSTSTQYIGIGSAATRGTFAQSAASFTYTVYSGEYGTSGSTALTSGSMTYSGAGGVWTASIPSGLACSSGCEIVVHGTYTFQGLARTWDSFYGFSN